MKLAVLKKFDFDCRDVTIITTFRHFQSGRISNKIHTVQNNKASKIKKLLIEILMDIVQLLVIAKIESEYSKKTVKIASPTITQYGHKTTNDPANTVVNESFCILGRRKNKVTKKKWETEVKR